MIVMAIILILATLGAGRYEQAIIRAHEAALKQDLFVMRNAIQQYTLDKEAGPNSLDDLVSAGYLREIPRDPITRQKEWTTSSDDILASPDQTASESPTCTRPPTRFRRSKTPLIARGTLGVMRLLANGLIPRRARARSDNQLQLPPLIVHRKQIPGGDRGKAALRAQREIFQRHIFGGFVDAAQQQHPAIQAWRPWW